MRARLALIRGSGLFVPCSLTFERMWAMNTPFSLLSSQHALAILADTTASETAGYGKLCVFVPPQRGSAEEGILTMRCASASVFVSHVRGQSCGFSENGWGPRTAPCLAREGIAPRVAARNVCDLRFAFGPVNTFLSLARF